MKNKQAKIWGPEKENSFIYIFETGQITQTANRLFEFFWGLNTLRELKILKMFCYFFFFNTEKWENLNNFELILEAQGIISVFKGNRTENNDWRINLVVCHQQVIISY